MFCKKYNINYSKIKGVVLKKICDKYKIKYDSKNIKSTIANKLNNYFKDNNVLTLELLAEFGIKPDKNTSKTTEVESETETKTDADREVKSEDEMEFSITNREDRK